MDTKPIKILVVEDSTPQRSRIIRHIESGEIPAEVISAADVRAALAVTSDNVPDLAFIDQYLPDRKGIDLIRMMKNRGDNTYFILMAALGSEEIVQEATRQDIDDFVNKGEEKATMAAIDFALEKYQKRREKQKIEETLSEQCDFLNSILNGINEGLIVIDCDYKIRNVNTYFVKQYGKTREKLIGRHCYEATHKTPEVCQATKYQCPLVYVVETGESCHTEHIHKVRDGKDVIVELSAYPLFDDYGKVESIISISRDITEIKRAGEELHKHRDHLEKLVQERTTEQEAKIAERKLIVKKFRQQNEFLKAILESLAHPFYVVDINDYKIKIANSAAGFGNLSEYTFCYTLTHKRNTPCMGIEYPCPIEEIKRTKGPVSVEHIHYDKFGNVRNLEIHAYPIFDREGNITQIIEYNLDITTRKRAQEDLEQSPEKLRKTLEGTINALASITELRDPFIAGHQQRVSKLACAIAREMGLSEEQIKECRMAGMVHDIGKISVPVDILNKPGKLTDTDMDFVKGHCQSGYEVLKQIEFPWPIAEIVLQHHERMNGSGYPQGLSGEEIILEARILGVADVVEAMASHRPYRPAHDVEKALEEISKNKGIIYDPEVVDVCMRLFSEKGFELLSVKI